MKNKNSFAGGVLLLALLISFPLLADQVKQKATDATKPSYIDLVDLLRQNVGKEVTVSVKSGQQFAGQLTYVGYLGQIEVIEFFHYGEKTSVALREIIAVKWDVPAPPKKN